jgi:L-threonylcarbamoyladenylate synthase
MNAIMEQSYRETLRIIPASDQAIAEAARALGAGELVAFPTETVYGLGANALDGEAVAAIFAAKGRPRFNPLIVHLADAAAVSRHAVLDDAAKRLAAAFWPGPLSLVLPKRAQSGISPLVSAGLETIAFRVPGHPVAQTLLRMCGLPVAAPRANRSGRISPTSAADVAAELGDAPVLILDGGSCPVGLESTVVRVMDGRAELLRTGGTPREEIEAVLGQRLDAPTPIGNAPASPGQLASHYAPNARLRLNATAPRQGEAFLAFGPDAPETAGASFNLSPSGDLKEAAATLFSALRRLDETGSSTIAVMPIPDHGLGEAINDRLARAAADRP